MNRKEKEVVVSNVLETFNKCSGMFIIDFKKINALKIIELKKNLFKSNGKVVVVKNSLLVLAAKQNKNLKKVESSFQKQIALIYAFGDVFQTTAVVDNFLKNSENIKFKAGFISDVELDSVIFEKISKIHSQDDLRSKLCGVLINPIVSLISTLMQISKN